MIEKKKKTASSMGTIPFVLLWTLTYGVGWAVVFGGGVLIDMFYRLYQLPQLMLVLLLGGVPGFISSVFQQTLLRRKFNVTIPRWWLWSTLASTAAGGALHLYFEFLEDTVSSLLNHNLMLEVSLVLGVIFAIPALIQALMLRGHVKRVWLWVLAAFVSAATYALGWVDRTNSNEFFWVLIFGLAGILQGSVMGLTLAWLFGMTRSAPLKNSLENVQLQHTETNLAYHHNEAIADYPQAEITRQRK